MDNKIKLVVTDLDGTLLDSAKKIPDGFFDAVLKLRAHGIRTIIASGRQYYNVMKLFAPVCDSVDVVAENGGLAFLDGNCLFVNALSEKDVSSVLEVASGIPTAWPLLCGVECAYARTGPEIFKRSIVPYYERREVGPSAYDHAFRDTICKVAIFEEQDASLVYSRFEHLSDRLNMTLSGLNWLDFMNLGADKGVGLKAIQDHLGITPGETMGFGDYDNDLGMLGQCGESYAMANAVDRVKAVCRHQAPSNDEDGVMATLRREFGFL